MQGADVAGVAIGTFKPDKIARRRRAAQDRGGYARGQEHLCESDFYTAGGLGFTVLTARTVIFGNETGIRRALDRIEEGRVQRRLTPWMLDILEKPSAPLAAGADLTSQPLPKAAWSELEFLEGMKTASLVGNFQDPGLNLAGTMTYEKPEDAKRGADRMLDLYRQLGNYSIVMALFGFPQPIKKLDAQAEEDKVRFVAGVDGQAVAVLLDKAQSYLASVSPPPK